MADQIQLRVVTPREAVVDEAVREVTGPGTLGEFGVLPDHAAYLTSLECGPLRYRGSGGDHRLAVRGGFAEVRGNVMTVLAEAAERAEDIDTERAESDLRAAEEKLRQLSPQSPEYDDSETERRWAQARLDITRGR